MIKAFGGLVIFRAIAGNITSYSREIYAPLKSLLLHGLFPSYSRIFPQLCFPCNCWYFSQVHPGYCPRFSLGIVPAFYGNGDTLLVKKKDTSMSLQCRGCDQWVPGFNSRWVQCYFVSPQHHIMSI